MRRPRPLNDATMMMGGIAVAAMTPSSDVGGAAAAFAFSPVAPMTTNYNGPIGGLPTACAGGRDFDPFLTRENGRSRRRHSTPLRLGPVVGDNEAISAFVSSSLLSGDAAASASSALSTLLQNSGNVPFLPSLALNALLFFSLKPKLDTMLTPEGFFHSLALGTMLWTALGWRGWTVCVLYLFLGQLVTKVGFEEKTKLGIAE
eukprot:CAMPEP_0172532850 /NCGR_PEP_ID=MMETSP1067-20121228/5754_1 /TAXON_ID=265564 ORGANISM="Thalassiosira punctigera, Strain Tpunct2005C2" /NCGR_SAMPLE_ID=MMETSP1067 /ASSEMBLY_ACC=CAM_ASM_000444 /LENGTH=202 /DNA_ID=CAMNT_0013317407 /DNA_START=53 /DNA_END=658 /DNA_ORIENTATION=-